MIRTPLSLASRLLRSFQKNDCFLGSWDALARRPPPGPQTVRADFRFKGGRANEDVGVNHESKRDYRLLTNMRALCVLNEPFHSLTITTSAGFPGRNSHLIFLPVGLEWWVRVWMITFGGKPSVPSSARTALEPRGDHKDPYLKEFALMSPAKKTGEDSPKWEPVTRYEKNQVRSTRCSSLAANWSGCSPSERLTALTNMRRTRRRVQSSVAILPASSPSSIMTTWRKCATS